MTKQGIFCLEGDWGGSLIDRLSVRPGLDMLTRMRDERLIHRNAATKAEFEHYMSQWVTRRYAAFPLAYLSYHGRRGQLDLGGDHLELAELAELVAGRLTGRIVYFGSCETLALGDDELRAFVTRTGARGIVGYTKQVDWARSAAFDFTLLPELLDSVDLRKLYSRLRRNHPYFVDGLGLRIATASWVGQAERAGA